MIITRKTYIGRRSNGKAGDKYGTISCHNLKFGIGLSPVLKTVTRVLIDTVPDVGFRLIPTNLDYGHKISWYNNQASMSAAGLLNAMNVPKRVRIPCAVQDDGSLLFEIGGLDGKP